MAKERVQRRLAAILAADVVGYSRLMGEDETGTLTALKELRAQLIDPTIAEYQGRIVKLMGDGALVEFASVVDAVECAVTIQRDMAERNADIPDSRRIAFRIGVNLGDVIIEGDDIYGDGVNVAARLEGEAEPGGICISGDAYRQVLGKIDSAFEDMGERSLKNIDDPVRAYNVLLSDPTAPVSGALQQPGKPSIAVLPFDNLSGDPEQEYFSDGMAEDLITDISKISGLFVIARNSSFAFKGQTVDVKDIAEQLGVKHILEGSVRKMGPKLRINAQLVDAASGGHLWAERYDGDMAEIFQFQDDIREQIVSALQVSLTPTDKALTERKPTDSVEAYDLFLRGRANFHRYTSEHHLEAIQCFEEAIEIDPNFADAYGYLSFCHFRGWVQMWPGFDDTLDRALELAEKGVALDGTSGVALARLGWIQTWLRRYDQAVGNLEKAIALAPGNAEIHATFGDVINFWGNPERALGMVDKAFSLDTFAPPIWEYYAGKSHYLLRQYDQALTRFNRMVEWAPKFIHSYAYQACAYVELDRLDDARDAIKTLLGITPQYTLMEAARTMPFRRDEDCNRVLGALRIAGLPEGAEAADEAPQLPDKPSIAVLPFDNLSGDPEQEYFADGITEDIITALSRIGWLFVIARNTTFTFKGPAVDVPVVAKELGVRYVLEGSVRKAGSRVRITAQLIDGATGNHIWAERYDRELADIFAVQDEITENISGALEPQIIVAESVRVQHKTAQNLDAWDLVIRAMARIGEFSRDGSESALKLLDQAIEIDPTYSRAYSHRAWTTVWRAFQGWEEMDTALQKATEMADKAIRYDAEEPWAYIGWLFVSIVHKDNQRMVSSAKKAIELNPNFAYAHSHLGAAYALGGHGAEAFEWIEKARRLSPRDMFHEEFDLHESFAHFQVGDYEQGAVCAAKASVPRPEHIFPHLIVAACHGQLGNTELARQEVIKVRQIVPSFSLAAAEKRSVFVAEDDTSRFLDGLQKAGLSE
jgi:TolB-like protein/Flp pilus assembly protein TadD